jgi:putative DNA-invertase from lambdoid prophage Rac
MSGKIAASQRPQFSKLPGQIRDGETLVVTKLDRLGAMLKMSAPR